MLHVMQYRIDVAGNNHFYFAVIRSHVVDVSFSYLSPVYLPVMLSVNISEMVRVISNTM